MLWQKSWWETRWSLVPIMGVILVFAALNQRLDQADLDKWILELQKRAPAWSEDSRRLLPLLSSYQGYLWYYWFRLIMLTLWPTVAMGMGATTLLHSSCPWTGSGAGIFTFSLPVSRRRILLTHVALVALEMVLLALLSSLIIPIASSMFGTDVHLGSALIHALLLSLGGMVFLALSFLLAVVFTNPLKVLFIGIALIYALFFPFYTYEEFPWWNVFHLMSGETYFRYGRIPWSGLLASLGVSALMIFAALRIYERRNF